MHTGNLFRLQAYIYATDCEMDRCLNLRIEFESFWINLSKSHDFANLPTYQSASRISELAA